MTAKNSLRQDMPYEKFIALGPEALSDAELIAIILRTGTRSFSALELAKRILRKTNGSDKGLFRQKNQNRHVPVPYHNGSYRCIRPYDSYSYRRNLLYLYVCA